MQAATDSSAVSHLGQPIGDLTGPEGSAQESFLGPIAEGGAAVPAAEGEIVVGPVALWADRVAKVGSRLRLVAADLMTSGPEFAPISESLDGRLAYRRRDGVHEQFARRIEGAGSPGSLDDRRAD